jgi:hypothetical protein
MVGPGGTGPYRDCSAKRLSAFSSPTAAVYGSYWAMAVAPQSARISPARDLARVNKGFTLGALGRSDEEIALYDELLARFADAPEPTIGQLVEWARKVRTDAER